MSAEKLQPAAKPAPLPGLADDEPTTPGEIQFTLKTLLASVAVIAGLLAVVTLVNTLTSVLLIWFVLLVFCHVAGNAWGTKAAARKLAQQQAKSQRAKDQSGNAQASAETLRQMQAAPLPASHLSHRSALKWWLLLPIPAGAVLGGYAGLLLLFGRIEDVPTWRALIVTGISSGLIGGFLAFLISSFLGVAIFALFDAHRHSRQKLRS